MTSGRCTGGANQSFSFLSRYKSVGGYTVVQLLTYPETRPRQLPYNCVCTSGRNTLANGTHRASVLWGVGDDAAVIRTGYLSMNVRNVLVVSLLFVPCTVIIKGRKWHWHWKGRNWHGKRWCQEVDRIVSRCLRFMEASKAASF